MSGDTPRTIFLTGATGVVGRSILSNLDGFTVVAGVNRQESGTGAVVRIDLGKPRLGLNPIRYRDLCARTDMIIHAGAIVDFTAPLKELNEINVDGVRRVVQLAADADAPLIHISTAYVTRLADAPAAPGGPFAYLTSKRAGEAVVRESGIRATIVRPSTVMAGQVGRVRPALHVLAKLALAGRVPFVPAQPDAVLDLVPHALVSAGVRALIETPPTTAQRTEFWLTAGQHALGLPRLLALVTEEGRAAGLSTPTIRVVDPSAMDRLFRPAFGESLGHQLRALESTAPIFDLALSASRLPTSFGTFPGSPLPVTTGAVEAAWRALLRELIRNVPKAGGHGNDERGRRRWSVR